MDYSGVLAALTVQAGVCAQMGSPFSGRVLGHVRADVERGGPCGAFFTAWDGCSLRELMDEAVSLRILGGLQHLVLSGADPGLAAVYPASGAEPDDAALASAIDRAVAGGR